MYETIRQLAHTYHHETIQCRRHIHQYAESGWLEMKTACLVAQQLQALGYEVKLGQEIMNKDDRMGLPGQDIFDQHYLRAQQEGAPLSYLQQVKDGMTAVAGILKNGSGPVVAMRFDMDALGLDEDTSAHHFPASHHFISCHQGVMHACGHDGHTAIGLTTAKILMELKDHWNGTLKLIFQPAEEGVRGARSICTSHFLDDVDYIFASHIMPQESDHDLYFGMNDSFATTKLDVTYHGVSTHAAESPQFGKNALLSAANCIINLHSIPRNADGQTRVNVGKITAGTGRNVIPETAKLEIVECDEDFMNEIRGLCQKHMPDLKLPEDNLSPLGGSDDFSYMMMYVQAHGGQATYLKLLSPVVASPHNSSFDFDEEALEKGPRIMASIAYHLLK